MEETFEVKKAIIFLVVLVLIIGIFYGITVLVVDHKKEKEAEENEPYTSIQYEEIIVSNILKQTADDYYVLATTKNDENYKQYISDFTTYPTTEGALPTYRIDLDNGFNQKYLQSESDFSGSLPVFKTSTLIRVVNHEIAEVYQDMEVEEAILYLVNGMVKE